MFASHIGQFYLSLLSVSFSSLIHRRVIRRLALRGDVTSGEAEEAEAAYLHAQPTLPLVCSLHTVTHI